MNYFIGWTQSELEAELRRAQEDLSAGKSITETRAGEISARNQLEGTIRDRIQLILRALNSLDPDKYPSSDITPITSCKIVFST